MASKKTGLTDYIIALLENKCFERQIAYKHFLIFKQNV